MDEMRATGRTSRQVDSLIQEMFNNRGKWIDIIDHFDSVQTNRSLFVRVNARLINEFSRDVYTNRIKRNLHQIKIDK